MKIVQFLLDHIDPSLKERTGEAIHNRYYANCGIAES
jgi:hypothetical protein